jgi:putative nucleotidyltransferase with HDIG domain
MHIQTQADALKLLQTLDAPAPLLRHAKLVTDVATQVIACLNLPKETLNISYVLIGAVLHDVGKIKHPRELHEAGHEHEVAGYEILASFALPEPIAEMCIVHSQWENASTLEALIVALADNLWKGKRITELEDRVIREVADLLQADFWSVYTASQPCFDQIADSASIRLLS